MGVAAAGVETPPGELRQEPRRVQAATVHISEAWVGAPPEPVTTVGSAAAPIPWAVAAALEAAAAARGTDNTPPTDRAAGGKTATAGATAARPTDTAGSSPL